MFVACACSTKTVTSPTDLVAMLLPRIADAARISPYPSTIRAQEPVSPDGREPASGSTSKGRLLALASSSSSRPRAERPTTQQEIDARFNLGPRITRSGMGRRIWRGGRSGQMEEIDEGVPDYPPPSFQEALSTSIAGSSTAGPSAPRSYQLHPQMERHDISEADLSTVCQPDNRGSPPTTPSFSGSDDSLEFIENYSVPSRAQDQWEDHQNISFLSQNPSIGSTTCVNGSVFPSSDELIRGRGKTKLRNVFNMPDSEDVDMQEAEAPSTPVQEGKKRFLSLSPLRTLFPPRHRALQAKAFSAHPSPGTSPYSTPRSTQLFRSTTSLATASALRLPFSGSTLTLSTKKDEHSKPSRRFFHKKAKESLDTWEVLERGESPEVENKHLPTLMSPMAVVLEPPSPPVSPEISPTQYSNLMFGTPQSRTSPIPQPGTLPMIQPETSRTLQPTSLPSLYLGTSSPPQSSPPSSPPLSPPSPATITTRTPERTLNEPHELSLRDRKIDEILETAQKTRRRNRAPRTPTRTQPRTVEIPNPSPPGAGPPIVTVRTSKKAENRMTGQPVAKDTPDLQSVVKTTLSSDPVRGSSITGTDSMISSSSSQSSSIIIDNYSPTTPVARTGAVGHNTVGERNAVLPPPLPTSKLPMLDTTVQRSNTIVCTQKHPPVVKTSVMQTHQNTSFPYLPLERAAQIGHRHHYRGRPLPLPPGTRNVVDSVYAGHEGVSFSSDSSNHSGCPEGLLIDLDDDLEQGVSGTWLSPPSEYRSAPMSPNNLSPVEIPRQQFPDLSVRSVPVSFSPASPPRSGLSEITDLDLLVAAIGEGNGDYETLVLITSFLGSVEAARSDVSTNAAVDETRMLLTGRVEVQRRRVTADGRVKLKLSMFGSAVNKCGVCLSQFKDGQFASMNPPCGHVFHENCLEQWLIRSKTCPLCRIVLDSGNH